MVISHFQKQIAVVMTSSIFHFVADTPGKNYQFYDAEIKAVFTKDNASETFRNIPKDLERFGIIRLTLLLCMGCGAVNTTLLTKIYLK